MHAQQKLIPFHWEGTNQLGEQVKGEQLASSAKLVHAILRSKGIAPHKVCRKAFPFLRLAKIRPIEITLFTRQIATLILAGIPLIRALNVISRGHRNPSMRELIDRLQTTIEQGNSVAAALNEYPRYFSNLYCSLVLAGEHSGTLDVLFDRIATYKEKTDTLIRKIKRALYYPLVVILLALCITLVLLILVIPQFQMLYASFDAVLPGPTRWIISLSALVQTYWWLLVLVVPTFSLGFAFALRSSSTFAIAVDQLLLHVPVVGQILEKSAIAKFARTLATTFAAGMPIGNALQIIAGSTGNRIFTNAIINIRENVMIGQSLNVAAKQTKHFPGLVIQMIAIGEESGTLEKMLNKIATLYENDVDHLIENIGTLLEPAIMVILGILIGGFVIAMYLPIFKLGSIV